jgi:hypothetical protein
MQIRINESGAGRRGGGGGGGGGLGGEGGVGRPAARPPAPPPGLTGWWEFVRLTLSPRFPQYIFPINPQFPPFFL